MKYAAVLGRVMLFGSWIVLALPLRAATYVVDPVHGSDRGAGNTESPWRTLEAVLRGRHAWAAGDVILLRTGDHGRVLVRGEIAGGEVQLRAADGQAPVVRELAFKGAAHWNVSGLILTPEGAPGGTRRPPALVTIDAVSHDVVVRDCTLYSARDSSTWTEADWLARAVDGISSAGAHCTIANNRLHNVRFGIVVGRNGHDSVVSGNLIEDFMSDGMRGLADDCRFENNVVKNCYKIDDNHDDGFQSWSTGADGHVGTGVVKRVVLRGNVFISYTNPAQPYKAAMQGIGCFDGMFEDWVIENNVVITDMWHGIALFGATRCRIVNNTVVKNPINAAPRTPWIAISPHKQGAASSGNLVRNNIASTLHVPAEAATVDHNLVAPDYDAVFVNYADFDLHLRRGSPAIDAGSDADAPHVDRDGRPRTSPADLGAYEANLPDGRDTGVKTR